MKIAAVDVELSDITDIDVVGSSVLDAVAIELRFSDINGRTSDGTGQDAILIIVKPIVGERQDSAGFEANRSPIVIGNGDPRDFQIREREVGGILDQRSFAIRWLSDWRQLRQAESALNGKVMRNF